MLWTTWAFWRESLWRCIRTFCQTLAGLLITMQVSNAFSAPWTSLLGASLLAALTSLLMSVDRSTADAQAQAAVVAPVVAPVPPVANIACGDQLRYSPRHR